MIWKALLSRRSHDCTHRIMAMLTDTRHLQQAAPTRRPQNLLVKLHMQQFPSRILHACHNTQPWQYKHIFYPDS
jgi:hypothetical protein